MRWIVTGASTSGREWLRHVAPTMPDAVRIAANSAITWYLEDGHHLDYAWLTDAVACPKYGPAARAMRKQYGTKLCTIMRSHEALRHRGQEDFDIFVGNERRGIENVFEHGRYHDVSLSGIWCMQFALNHWATEVHVIGQEGYRSRATRNSEGEFVKWEVQVPDYADGSAYTKDGPLVTAERIEPAMNAMVRACPVVKFHFYGDLSYRVEGPNVEVHQCASVS